MYLVASTQICVKFWLVHSFVYIYVFVTQNHPNAELLLWPIKNTQAFKWTNRISKQIHVYVAATKGEKTRVMWARHNFLRFYIWLVEQKSRKRRVIFKPITKRTTENQSIYESTFNIQKKPRYKPSMYPRVVS